ncbi:MAG: alkaline phosphatase [Chlorobiaceae bacterium]|nr:alkaline phosphatase [Chlorobiaceae bacterium]
MACTPSKQEPSDKPDGRIARRARALWGMISLLSLLLLATTAEGKNAPRYIFLFIGDGMGPAQVELASRLLPEGASLAMTSFPVTGMAITNSANRLITDSGAAGTALATGFKTDNGMISLASNGLDTLKTIAEMARDRGMRTGIVTSVGIDNATPACFYAHNRNRDNYYDIALQMATSRFDYFGGGYAEGDLPAKRAKTATFRGSIPEIMERSGYRIARNLTELASIPPGKRCWAYAPYDSKAALLFDMDRKPGEVDLAAFTREGIRLLDNQGGLFMMVEGGKIDWACHANDAAAAARDVQAFDAAIREALVFYRRHPAETLIVVTADHECGGFSLGNLLNAYTTIRPELLKQQRVSSQKLSEKVSEWKRAGNVSHAMALDSIRVWFGLSVNAADTLMALSPANLETLRLRYAEGKPASFADAVTRILDERAGIGWASNVHTMTPVQVFAMGAGSGVFSGMYDNTLIARKIMQLTRFDRAVPPTRKASRQDGNVTSNNIRTWKHLPRKDRLLKK